MASSELNDPTRRDENLVWNQASLIPWGLVIAAIIVGFSIPSFYDWSGADQSRPAPVVGWVALAIFVADLIAWILIGIFAFRNRGESVLSDRPRYRFTISHIILLTVVVALMMFLGRATSATVVSWIFNVMVWGFVIWQVVSCGDVRSRVVPLLLCYWGPFVWTLRDISQVEILGMIPALPAILPALMVSSLMRVPFQGSVWLLPLISSIELLIGVFVMRRGPWMFLAYLLFILTLAIYGSFGMNAMMRM